MNAIIVQLDTGRESVFVLITWIATRAAGMISSTLMEERSDRDICLYEDFSGVPQRDSCRPARPAFRKGRDDSESPSLMTSSSSTAGMLWPTRRNLKKGKKKNDWVWSLTWYGDQSLCVCVCVWQRHCAPGQLETDWVDALSGLIVDLWWDGVPLHDIHHQTEEEKQRKTLVRTNCEAFCTKAYTYMIQLDKLKPTANNPDSFLQQVCSLCYLRPPALRKFSQKDLLLVLAISSSDVGMSFELKTLKRTEIEEGRKHMSKW